MYGRTDEREDFVDVCADCGSPVEVRLERGFAFGEDGALCFECAVRRGGEYEPEEERWLEPPDTSDLSSLFRSEP